MSATTIDHVRQAVVELNPGRRCVVTVQTTQDGRATCSAYLFFKLKITRSVYVPDAATVDEGLAAVLARVRAGTWDRKCLMCGDMIKPRATHDDCLAEGQVEP